MCLAVGGRTLIIPSYNSNNIRKIQHIINLTNNCLRLISLLCFLSSYSCSYSFSNSFSYLFDRVVAQQCWKNHWFYLVFAQTRGNTIGFIAFSLKHVEHNIGSIVCFYKQLTCLVTILVRKYKKRKEAEEQLHVI